MVTDTGNRAFFVASAPAPARSSPSVQCPGVAGSLHSPPNSARLLRPAQWGWTRCSRSCSRVRVRSRRRLGGGRLLGGSLLLPTLWASFFPPRAGSRPCFPRGHWRLPLGTPMRGLGQNGRLLTVSQDQSDTYRLYAPEQDRATSRQEPEIHNASLP